MDLTIFRLGVSRYWSIRRGDEGDRGRLGFPWFSSENRNQSDSQTIWGQSANSVSASAVKPDIYDYFGKVPFFLDIPNYLQYPECVQQGCSKSGQLDLVLPLRSAF